MARMLRYIVVAASVSYAASAAAPVDAACEGQDELSQLQLRARARESRQTGNVHGPVVPQPSAIALPTLAARAPPLPGGIPRILHQEWKRAPLPEDMAEWHESWRRCLGDGWELKLWTDEENRALVERHFPEFLPTFDGYDEAIKRFDSVRYIYMYVYGGVYADLDLECVGSPLQALGNHSLLLSYAAPYCFMQSAFFASAPGHPFWRQALEGLSATKAKRVMEATGPVFLSRVFEEFTEQKGRSYHIDDKQLFRPRAVREPMVADVAVIGNEHICWDYTSIAFGTCASDYPHAFAVNHKTQSWKNDEHKFARRGQPKMGQMRCGNDKKAWHKRWIDKEERCKVWRCPSSYDPPVAA